MARKFRTCWRRRARIVRVVGRALDPAVPRPVVVGAVPAALAVGVVVLLVVGDQIGEREAVVAGDEVDAGERPAPGGLVEIGATGQAFGQIADGGAALAPVVADRVAELAVPLRPQGREVADLVAAVADVPGLGDQLDLADHGILLDDVEEGGQPVDLVELAGQAGRQVEAEAVHVHLEHPVAQGVHHQLQHVGIADVEGVAGSGGVVVEAGLSVDQPVVARVVDAPEGQGRARGGSPSAVWL